LLALLTFFYYYAWKNDQLCSKILPQIDITYTDKHITIHWHCINNDSTCNISENFILSCKEQSCCGPKLTFRSKKKKTVPGDFILIMLVLC